MENKRVDSRGIISDYIFFSKYSRVKPDGKKETWDEAVTRVMQMHMEYFDGKIKPENQEAFSKVFNEAWSAYSQKKILGSQRALQYGGKQLLKNHLRLYNCMSSYLNRVEFFEECMEALLSGCVPADTPILTENGVKKFSEVKKGDLVWSRNQETGVKELKPVLKTHDVLVKSEDQVKIKGLFGEFTTSKKHPVLVFRSGHWSYVKAGEINKGEILCRFTEKRNEVSLNERAYFVGAYLGDGHSHRVACDGLRLNMMGSEREVIENFAKITTSLSGFTFEVKDWTETRHLSPVWGTEKTLHRDSEFSKNFLSLVGEGMCGNKTSKIRIPEWIRNSMDYNLFVNFLAGLIDTDGSVDKNKNRPVIHIATISQQMAIDIKEMASLFGINVWVGCRALETQSYQRIKPKHDLYNISLPVKEIPEVIDLLACDHKREILKQSFSTSRRNKKLVIPEDLIEEESSYLNLDKKTFWHFDRHIKDNLYVYASYYTNRDRSFNHILQYEKVVEIETDLGLDENFKDLSIADNNNYFIGEGSFYNLHNCGTGYSVQRHHTEMLPPMRGLDRSAPKMKYTIPDSIEGWSHSVGLLVKHYYNHLPEVEFDYSEIRDKGAFISGGFKAPGSEPLKECHTKIASILNKIKDRKLTPFELHYITCIIANAVISGGIRRSAMIAIFDIDDIEMLNCKTGDWFQSYPELCRCNNSAAIYPETQKEEYLKIFQQIQQFGEPGIAFTKSKHFLWNPCFEIGMFPQIKNRLGITEYGWSTCNLTEINGAKIKTEQDFYKACRTASILGTFQAAYTDFPVLSEASKKIGERDALIGVGITGMADNPDILFDEEIQRYGAQIVKDTNDEVASILGINTAARTTAVKPSGNSSQLLGSASGVHFYHFRKYIRNIQAADTEQALREIVKTNPQIAKASFWNPQHEQILSFPIELPDNAMVRGDASTLDFLKRIYSTKMHWIEEGTNWNHPSTKENPSLRHNVSCTVSVKDNEWREVADWIWENREGFCGLSFLPETGDLDYPQAPYSSYLDEKELSETYGPGAILSSGLIVDGLNVFNDIWTACNAANGRADNLLKYTDDYLLSYIKKHLKEGKLLVDIDGLYVSDLNAISSHLKHKVDLRVDWVRRFKKFAKQYFNGDEIKCANCLKHVNIFHQWQRLTNINAPVWEDVEWEQEFKEVSEQVGTSCAGGACLV